jgi:hypothetical protein
MAYVLNEKMNSLYVIMINFCYDHQKFGTQIILFIFQFLNFITKMSEDIESHILRKFEIM